MNLLGYIIFLFFAYLITVHVGLVFFKKGRVYILFLMQGDEHYSDAINRLLLIGYYLVNLGYAAVMISFWGKISTLDQLIGSVSTMLGRQVVGLAILHYCNMLVIYFLSVRHKKSLNL